MYTPSFKVKKSGVPILSKEDIEVIGERFIRDFCPDALINPQPIDVDKFIESYLGLTPDYQYLSHNGIYLGMTVFNDTDKVIVFSPETQKAEYIHAKARTVIIDNRLLESNQEHRYRFTVMHEGSHDICHSGFFSYNPNQISMFNDGFEPMIQCRVDNYKYGGQVSKQWDDHDWMEWQANKLGAVLLMPKVAVCLVAEQYRKSKRLHDPVSRALLIAQISGLFNVSISAATYRLKDLGYIPQNDNTDYSYGSVIQDFAGVVAN